jgi:AcrR family transcriptional regulator
LAGAGRVQRRRQETSEKIFIAAVELFSRKGFAHTTVEEITKAADVGKGTFFNYFPSKEHVLGYLVSRQQGIVREHQALALEGMKSPEVLTSLGRSLMLLPGKSPQMARSLISAFLGNAEVREYIMREMSVGRRWIAEIIRLGQKRGELSDELAPMEAARIFQRALMGTVLMWALDPSSMLEKQFGGTMRTLFNGLGASPIQRRGVRGKIPPTAVKRERTTK